MRRNGKNAVQLVLGCLMALIALSCSSREDPEKRQWQAMTSNAFWRANVEPVPVAPGEIRPAIVVSFSGYAAARPDDRASVRIPVSIPVSGRAELSFELRDGDSAEGPGRLLFEVLADGVSLFRREPSTEKDLSQPVRLDLRPASPEGGHSRLEFRLARGDVGGQAVVRDNHEFFVAAPVTGCFVDPQIITERGTEKLLPDLPPAALSPVPPDLALPQLPANGMEWTKGARIVQLWGKTQWDAVVRAAERAPWLAREFGFNTMIVLPPEAHNAISAPGEEITEKQFERALEIYRANGFRIIMYTSIMHCGHAPVWQDGTLESIHPEWSQRGPKGEPIRIYGRNWLCPSTGALPYTLDYTLDLVRRYKPDLVMLDNSEFFATPSGVSCYCPGCQVEFRRYLRQRFGESVAGLPTDSVAIPTESGFLYDLWVSWRNRVWGEAHEVFRRELRRVKPDIVLMSNTQYLRQAPDLATDLIYDHEDALISESVGMTMDGMINKLLLGRALARGKPLWNYLGTFQSDDYDLLVPPDAIAMNISIAFACGVRPWIVYRGFYEKPSENEASLDRLGGIMTWHNAQKFGDGELKPYAPVLSLVSLNSRNYRLSGLVPDHLTPLRRRGICSWIVEERAIEEGVPESCRVLLIERAPCLSDRAVGAIVGFLKSGGVVIACPNTAWYDELGRLRRRSALWEACGLDRPPGQATKIGRGEIVCLGRSEFASESIRFLEPYRFGLPGNGECSLIPYTDALGSFVVYVCSMKPLSGDLGISAPGNRPGRAVICASSAPTPSLLSF